jgi:putative ABC transport system ATP-binding protein
MKVKGEIRLMINRNPQEKPIIELVGVSKTYKNAAGSFTALKRVDVNFYEGEFVGVIGKSGSGKSTLVNMITGIDRPTEGKVVVSGLDVHAMKESQQARWRGLNLGVVFQFFQLLPMLTLVENVVLPMDFCDQYEPAARMTRALDLLDMVGLGKDAHKLPGAVSGGQQQSAAIARALANDPPIIIADEPTGNLDAKTAESVYEKFEDLSGEGRTIIMITHDPEIEGRLSRKVLLSDGEVIEPALSDAFSWLLRPSLRRLGRQLERYSLVRNENLDVTGEFRDRILLVKEGAIKLSFDKKPYSKKEVILLKGCFFAGVNLIEEKNLGRFSAQVHSHSAQVFSMGWSSFFPELDTLEGGRELFQSRLKAQMLGRRDEWKSEGLIK